MGGKIGVIIGILATIVLYGTGHPILFWLAIAAVAVDFWSWGIMHNYAMLSAKAKVERLRENMVYEGRSPEEISRLDQIPIKVSNADLEAVPNSWTMINMAATIGSLMLLIVGLVVRFA